MDFVVFEMWIVFKEGLRVMFLRDRYNNWLVYKVVFCVGRGLVVVGLIVEVFMLEFILLGLEGYGVMGKCSKWFCGFNISRG